MADPETIALLSHIKDIGERTERKLDDHVARDEQINKEFVLPIWNDFQQRQGAGNAKKTGGYIVDKVATIGISLAGAWAVMRGLK